MYTNRMLTPFSCLRLLFALVLVELIDCANVNANHNQIGLEASSDKLMGGLQEGFISLDDTLPEPHTREQSELLRDLHFVPSHIDFGMWSVGQARSQVVTLFNHHTNRTVHLNAVTGASPVFSASFFGSREVPPQGNTTFSVVFLPRQLGAISSDLLVHTSFGRTEFAVRGEGSECPYRLKPLVGIKAPMNATLTPEIHMYNPHERPLQIIEVYSSGGEFQLELPSGGSEGPQNLWEIPPHTLKPVIRISFHGRTAGNHSAYIRIKIAEQTDETALERANENILVIPVEFEILPKHAAYARNPLADFGRLATHHHHHVEALRFKLDMQNENVDASRRMLIGNYLRHIPGLSFDAHNASIVLDPKLFDESATINDLLVIRSSADGSESAQQEFTVLVRAEIFKGNLSFEHNITTFITSADEGQLQPKRSVVVHNNFAFPLALYNVSLSKPIDSSMLDIAPFMQQLLLQPGDTVELLQMHLLHKQATFKSTLRIYTNVTVFEIPVVSCSGKLHVSTQQFELKVQPQADYSVELDLGTVPFGEMSRDGYVVLRNDNPMAIRITDWNFKPPKNVYFTASFMSCLNYASESMLPEEGNANATFNICGLLNEGDIAVFQVSIKTYVPEPSMGTLKVWTPYEVIKTTVAFKASVGQLDIEQEQLKFRNCFPGKICTAVLIIRSSFIYSVHVTAVKFSQPGLRFKDFNAKGTTIGAETMTKVGRIYFEPAAMCKSNCYIKQSSPSDVIFPGGGGDNLLYDVAELRQRIEYYRQFKRQLNAMSLTLFSEELPPMELDFSIDVEWPKLVEPRREAPTIEVGQVQRQSVVISNPTPHALLVDYFLSNPKFARRTQLSLPPEVIDVSSSSCYLTDRDVFTLPSGVPSSPLLLPAGIRLSIQLEFNAQQAEKYCTLLHVRSNLTLYEAVWLTARAVQSQFRFGNRRPGSATPLLFELVPEQFESCDGTLGSVDADINDLAKTHSVTTTRTFTARNSGVVPMRIEGFLIGKRACEDFGFSVIDCSSFELSENETRKVEIAFSTDFTASRVSRSLTLITNLTYDISYSLLAQMPAENLERCAVSLPRPSWEQALRNTGVTVLLVSFILVVIAAWIDFRTILVYQTAFDAARYKDIVQPTFDLRNIAKSQTEEATSKLEAPTTQQLKLKNGQSKEIKKRTVLPMTAVTSNNNAEKPIRKPKSWTTWHVDMNVLSKHLEKSKLGIGQSASNDTNAKTVPPASASIPKPLSSPHEPKPSKKSTPSPQAQPQQQPQAPSRAQKKVKPNITPLQKPKAEPSIPATAEAQERPANLKTNGSQQENLSPRPAKFNAESPKEREPKVLKEQNGSTKKLGKTPGRERRKEQKSAQMNGASSGAATASAAPKKSERKQRNKQLNFYGNTISATNASPPASPDELKCITSPWETSSRVSFSDVLQTKQFPTIDNGMSWNGITNEVASTQLGPIGSKKNCAPQSISSIWEPSPISEAFAENKLVVQNEPKTFIGMAMSPALLDQTGHEADIYDRGQQQHAQWKRSDNQHLLVQQAQQQQQHRQQEELLQQHLQLLSDIETSNWAMNQPTPAMTWTPLGYTPSWPSQSSHAPSTSSVIRPPPGLESTYNSRQIATGSNTNHVDLISQNAHVSSSLQAQIDQHPNHMPTQYDPFTSPSSIWSDNWRQNQSQSSQQQQRNNHMN